MQQNKLIKGINLDSLIMDGGTGGGNSKRVNNYIKNKSTKRSNLSKKPSKKNKYKPIDMTNLIKFENAKNKKFQSKKKYSPHPTELRRKTNSVEPPSGLRMVGSPNNGQVK